MHDGDTRLVFERMFSLRVQTVVPEPPDVQRVGYLQIYWCGTTGEMLVQAQAWEHGGDASAHAAELRHYDSHADAMLSVPRWHARFRSWFVQVRLGEDETHQSRLPILVPSDPAYVTNPSG